MGQPLFLYKTYSATATATIGTSTDASPANLLSDQDNFGGAAWSIFGTGSVTQNVTVDPLGTLTADLLSDDDLDSDQNYIGQNIVIPNDSLNRVYSCYLRQGTAASTTLLASASGGTAVVSYATVTWATKTVDAGTIEDAGGGWYRVSHTITNNSTGNTSLQVRIHPAGRLISTTGTVSAWGALAEVGTEPSQRITYGAGSSVGDVLIPTEDTFYAPESTDPFSILIDLGDEYTRETGSYIAILGEGLDDNVTVEVFKGDVTTLPTGGAQAFAPAVMDSGVNAAWFLFDGEEANRYYRVSFSGHSSGIKIANLAIGQRFPLPYFATDWDVENLSIESSNIISQGGLFLGSTQLNAMRDLTLNIGDVNASELANLRVWVRSCIKESNPFYFVPDEEDSDVFYGWLDSPSFSAPYENALYRVAAMKMKTRAT